MDKVYLKFNIEDNSYKLDVINGNKPSSAMKELKTIETIVEKNIPKNGSILQLKSDMNTLINLKDNIKTIAEGFNNKANNKINSIQGKFFEGFRTRIIERRNAAVQNQMQKLTKKIDEKLEKLQPQDNSNDLLGSSKGFIENTQKLKRKTIKEQGSESFFFSDLFGSKKKEETVEVKENIIEEKQKKPINKNNQLANNKIMCNDLAQTPSNIMSPIKEAFYSDLKEGVKPKGSNLEKFINNVFTPVLSQDWVLGHVQEFAKKTKNTGSLQENVLSKFQNPKQVRNQGLFKDIEESIAQEIIPALTSTSIFNKGAAFIAIAYIKNNIEGVKKEIKEDSKLYEVIQEFDRIVKKLDNKENLTPKNIEQTKQDLAFAFVNVMMLSLEAINENNGKK